MADIDIEVAKKRLGEKLFEEFGKFLHKIAWYGDKRKNYTKIGQKFYDMLVNLIENGYTTGECHELDHLFEDNRDTLQYWNHFCETIEFFTSNEIKQKNLWGRADCIINPVHIALYLNDIISQVPEEEALIGTIRISTGNHQTNRTRFYYHDKVWEIAFRNSKILFIKKEMDYSTGQLEHRPRASWVSFQKEGYTNENRRIITDALYRQGQFNVGDITELF